MVAHEIKTETLHRRSVMIPGCSFVLGGLLGVFFVSAVDSETSEAVSAYLIDYFRLVECGETASSVLRTLWSHGRWIILCAVSGFSVLSGICIPALICLRAFLLAFSTGCLIYLFGRPGVIPAAVFFGLPALLWMPALYTISAAAMEFSLRHRAVKKGGSQAVVMPGRRFSRAIFLSFFMLIVCVCVECRLVPVLLPLAAGIIQ